MNYARNRGCRSRRELRDIVLALSFPRRVPPLPISLSILLSVFVQFPRSTWARRKRTRKWRECMWYVPLVCTVALRCVVLDGLPISRTSIAVRNWSGKRAFIASSTDEIRFRVELPTSILKRSINLDIDGFGGSLCVGIPLRRNVVRVYWKKLIKNRYSVILILITAFVSWHAHAYMRMFPVKISAFIYRVSRYRTDWASCVAIFVRRS